MTFRAELKTALQSMGMADAFQWPGANFAGFDGDPSWFYLGEVVHKAYVDVNEEGTEAAAATAVVGMLGGSPAATAGVSGGSSVSVPDSGERYGQHPLPGTRGQSDPDGAVMPPFRDRALLPRRNPIPLDLPRIARYIHRLVG